MLGFGNKKLILETPVDELQPGQFIEIPGTWWSHDFIRSKFVIGSQGDIDELRAAGITHVLVHSDKSIVPAAPSAPETTGIAPPPTPSGSTPASETANTPDSTMQTALLRGKEMRRLQEQAEQAHTEALEETRFVIKNLMAARPDVASRTKAFIQRAVGNIMIDDATLHLLSGRHGEMSLRFHSLQVVTLSLLTGKRLGLPEKELQDLATAALFHDTGLSRLQETIRSGEGTSRAEQNAYHAHVLYSVEMVKSSGAVSRNALAAILTHHEAFNGSGYPKQLSGESIPLLGRILAVTDRYDDLVNPAMTPLGMTPAEALARLFQQESERFDKQVLHAFAKSIGIYPPGTIVELSDGRYGLVIGVNTDVLMRPSVLLYEPKIPKTQAPVVDLLDSADLNITGCLSATHVPKDVHDYLNPRGRVAYFYSRGA